MNSTKDFFLKHFINLNLSSDYKFQLIIEFLNNSGYKRVQTVREFGEFSIRGSILDVFPVGNQSAFRIDFIGENIESIKTMDPLTQRSKDKINDFNIYTSNEFILNEKNIENFRKRFRSKNGAASINSLFEQSLQILNECNPSCADEELQTVISSIDFNEALIKEIEPTIVKQKYSQKMDNLDLDSLTENEKATLQQLFSHSL